MVQIEGNTYRVREQLKRLGCRWDAIRKAWLAPEDVAEQAQKLVGAKKACGTARRARLCQGCRCRINYGMYCGKCEFGR